jgi:hypothetical protein
MVMFLKLNKIEIIGIISILLVVVLASGCTSSSDSSSTSDTQSSDTSSQSSSFQTVKFSGTGDSATQSFKWPGGLMRVNCTHSGDSNFIVHLVRSSDGDIEEFLVNEIGSYNGSRGVSVSSGEYLFDIQADGPWTITVSK